MLRSWFSRSLWLVLTGLVILPVMEGFTRALLPQAVDTVLDILVADETVGYIYEPGVSTRERSRDYDAAFEINSLGLRDREYPTPAVDPYRVLLIGNSFCVSHGVDIKLSMSRALERELQRVFDVAGVARTVEVVNTSNAGYDSWNYWRSYRRWAPVFEPDVVLVGFVSAREHRCHQPDVNFVVRDGLVATTYRDGESPRIPRQNILRKIRKALARNSEFYVLLRNFFYYNERVQAVLKLEGQEDEALRTVETFRTPATERVAAGRQRSYDYMAWMRDDAGQDGVPVVIMAIPVKSDIVDTAWQGVEDRAAELGVEVDRDLPFQALSGALADRAIPIVDLVPALRQVGANGYFEHDNHWNEVGIAAAAALVAEQWSTVVSLP